MERDEITGAGFIFPLADLVWDGQDTDLVNQAVDLFVQQIQVMQLFLNVSTAFGFYSGVGYERRELHLFPQVVDVPDGINIISSFSGSSVFWQRAEPIDDFHQIVQVFFRGDNVSSVVRDDGFAAPNIIQDIRIALFNRLGGELAVTTITHHPSAD